MVHKILFVDDEPNVIKSLKRSLRQKPYEILKVPISVAAASTRVAKD